MAVALAFSIKGSDPMLLTICFFFALKIATIFDLLICQKLYSPSSDGLPEFGHTFLLKYLFIYCLFWACAGSLVVARRIFVVSCGIFSCGMQDL